MTSSSSSLGCWLHQQHIHVALMVGFMAGGVRWEPYLGIAGWITPRLPLGNHSRSRSSNSDRLQTLARVHTLRVLDQKNVKFGWKEIIKEGLDFLKASNKLIRVWRQMTQDCRCCMGITCTQASRIDREDLGRSDFLELTAFVVQTLGRCKSNGITCNRSFGVDQIYWSRNGMQKESLIPQPCL